jgi:hypothetical protein
MQPAVAAVLRQTLDSGDVPAAEAELDRLSASDDFVPALFGIYADASLPDSIRNAALLYAKHLLRHLWQAVPPAHRALFPASLASLIEATPPAFESQIRNFSRWVVRRAFVEAAEWPDLPAVAQALIAGGDPRVGLVLALALCGEQRAPLDLIATFAECVVRFADPYLLELAFHAACRLLMSAAPGDPPPAVLVIVEKSFVIREYRNDVAYFRLAVAALKFAVAFVESCGRRLPSLEIPAAYMQVISELFREQTTVKMRCLLCRLLQAILDLPSAWAFVEPDVAGFVMAIVLPLFALTADEVASFCDNPSGFVGDVHKAAEAHEDMRSDGASLLCRLAKDGHEDLVEAARFAAATTFDAFVASPTRTAASADLFSAFLLFAAVACEENLYEPKRLRGFFTVLVPLFECDDALARAAAFMLLAKARRVALPGDFLLLSLRHLIDPCPVVQYYAALSIASLIWRPGDTRALRAALAPVAGDLFRSLFALTEEFQDEEIPDTLCSLLHLFGEDLLPIAADLAEALLAHLLRASRAGLADQVGALLRSLDALVEVVTVPPAARRELAPVLAAQAGAALRELRDTGDFDSLVVLLVRLLQAAPFRVELWGIAPTVLERVGADPDVAKEDLLDLLSLLLVKDADAAARGALVPALVEFALQQMRDAAADNGAWCEFAKLAASLLLRLGAAHPLVASALPELAAMARARIGAAESVGLQLLVNALLLVGADAGGLLEWWIENPLFPDTVAVAVALFDAFAEIPHFQAKVLYHCAALLCGEILMRSPDDGDAFDQEADSETPYIWFDFPQTLARFAALLQVLADARAPAYAEFVAQLQREGEEECLEQLARIGSVAEAYESTKVLD